MLFQNTIIMQNQKRLVIWPTYDQYNIHKEDEAWGLLSSLIGEPFRNLPFKPDYAILFQTAPLMRSPFGIKIHDAFYNQYHFVGNYKYVERADKGPWFFDTAFEVHEKMLQLQDTFSDDYTFAAVATITIACRDWGKRISPYIVEIAMMPSLRGDQTDIDGPLYNFVRGYIEYSNKIVGVKVVDKVGDKYGLLNTEGPLSTITDFMRGENRIYFVPVIVPIHSSPHVIIENGMMHPYERDSARLMSYQRFSNNVIRYKRGPKQGEDYDNPHPHSNLVQMTLYKSDILTGTVTTLTGREYPSDTYNAKDKMKGPGGQKIILDVYKLMGIFENWVFSVIEGGEDEISLDHRIQRFSLRFEIK